MDREKILITSALPYANGPLHFGHIAGAYLPADVYARYARLKGHDVLFVCGSDEYGIATLLSAELAKRSPQEHVDEFHGINQAFFAKLAFSFDHYSRTTWPGHAATVKEFFLSLYKNGHIEEKVTDQLYSSQDARFLADRYVVGTCPRCGFTEARGDECQKCGASYEATDLKNPRSKLTGNPLTKKATTHWFLRFDHFKEQMASWLEKKEWKANVLQFAKYYVNNLLPRAITRDSEWGIPVPLEEAEGKVLYVWFDAPIGYISATKEWAEIQGDAELWQKYWLDPQTKLVQFIGKDNIPFHAVFFPAMVMGQDMPYKLVDQLPANEFLTLEGKQFSKSDGHYIDLASFFQKFTPDQIRYYLAANAPETQDSEFTWKDFQAKVNSDLVGKFGNFVNRVLTFAQSHTHAHVPEKKEMTVEDVLFSTSLNTVIEQLDDCYKGFHVRKATQTIMELCQLGNTYFDSKKPWKAAKDPLMHQDMLNTIALCLDAIHALSIVAMPIIPEACGQIQKMLYGKKLNPQFADATQGPEPKTKLQAPHLLFLRVEDNMISDEIEKLKTAEQKTPVASSVSFEPLKEAVGFEDFEKLDLRVVKIIAVEPVPKSKKLLKLTVDLGFETRTVVSGIGHKIPSDSLLGKKVVLLANLKPATIMGVESQGMILAGSFSDTLELPSFQSALPGANIS